MIDFDPLFLGSVGFLLTALVLIVARIIKLHYDEKRAHQRTEAILAMAADEDNQRRMRNAPQGKILFNAPSSCTKNLFESALNKRISTKANDSLESRTRF